jgi:transcriptional regulator with XRE-family HTH domain
MTDRPTDRPIIIRVTDLNQLVPALRYELGLSGKTQQELAEHMGVSYAITNRMLNGKGVLSVQQLFRLAGYLGIAVQLAPPKDTSSKPAVPEKARKTPVDLGVTLQDLFSAGKIAAGDILSSAQGEWNAIAEVGLRGDLILEDGAEYTSPSTAAKAVRGTTTNGWNFWAKDGQTLDSLRRELLK